ncbi:unnamed protein product, partial [Rotaria sp. Silwood2]
PEPFELERLIVYDDEVDDEVDEEEEPTVEDESSVHFITNDNLLQPGRVARAVSLCLFNKVPTEQLEGPETPGTTRYSIPSHNNHYRASKLTSNSLFRRACQNSLSTDKRKQNLTVSNNESLPKKVEHLYDGLVLLDEDRLDEMIETDLVSSSNG